MNTDKLRNALVSFLLAFTAGLGASGSLATAMGLEVNWVTLTFGCFALAAVFALTFQTSFWPIAMAAVTVLFYLWWREGTLRYSLEGAIYTISDLYDRGYGIVYMLSDVGALVKAAQAEVKKFKELNG